MQITGANIYTPNSQLQHRQTPNLRGLGDTAVVPAVVAPVGIVATVTQFITDNPLPVAIAVGLWLMAK